MKIAIAKELSGGIGADLQARLEQLRQQQACWCDDARSADILSVIDSIKGLGSLHLQHWS